MESTFSKLCVRSVLFVGLIVSQITHPLISAKAANTRELYEALVAARDEAEWPGISIIEVPRNLKTAEDALAFVRDGIALADYEGSYQGPDGLLRTRVGSLREKAGLLVAILFFKGYEVRLVSGEIEGEVSIHRPAGIQRSFPKLQALQQLIASGADQEPVLTSQEIESDRKQRLGALLKEVDSSYLALEAELQKQSWSPSPVADRSGLSRKYVWVQARKGTGPWETYDTFSDGASLPENPERVEFDGVQVEIKLVAQGVAGSGEVLVEWKDSSPSIAGREIQLTWIPGDERLKSASDLEVPLKFNISKWQPVLQVGGKKVKGKWFVVPKDSSPETPFNLRPSIRIEISVDDGGEVSSYQHVVQDLGEGYDPHSFFAIHRIGYVPTGIPYSVVRSRMLDELVDVAALKLYTEGGEIPRSTSADRALSTRTAVVANRMIETAFALQPNGQHFSWNGPTVFVETVRLGRRAEGVRSHAMLDMLNIAFAPDSTSGVADRQKWGLAVCAAEAQLLGGESVNLALMNGDGPFTSDFRTTQNRLVADALMDGGLVLTKPDRNQYAWAVMPDGGLRGIVSTSPLIAAKGGSSRETRVQDGANTFTALASGALAATGASPIAPLAGGIAGYLNELRKAYLGAAGKIQEITDLINGANTNSGQAPYDFQNLAGNLLYGMGEGYARSWASSVFSSGVSQTAGFDPNKVSGRLMTGMTSSASSFGASQLRISPEEAQAIVRQLTR